MSEFEKFCSEKQIRGNYEEALFHACAAEYGVERIDVLTKEEIAICWATVLSQALAKWRYKVV